MSVLILETGKTNSRRAEELVADLGFLPVVVERSEEALEVLAEGTDIVLVALPNGAAVARAAQGREDRPSVVVAVTGSAAEGMDECMAIDADSFVLRPYKREGLAVALRGAARLRAERQRAAQLTAELKAARELQGGVDPSTGFHSFDVFQTFLIMELKRARRYGYSLAACLVAVDGADELSPDERGDKHGDVGRAIKSSIRDIDLPVDYADGRFLVFLPYTDLAGAGRVGERIEANARKLSEASVSVGISALKPGKQISFARLIRDASTALRAAQLKGGGQVVVRG
jgi:diguanylate cyclase (GGDEF)-like protein